MKCDKCLRPEGVIKVFSCYQVSSKSYEDRSVCEKCVGGLVEKYFSRVDVPW